jgi:hypothetical protein
MGRCEHQAQRMRVRGAGCNAGGSLAAAAAIYQGT